MGSDNKSPMRRQSSHGKMDILWPLPVSDLFMAGKAAVAAMEKKNIRTIGDLARQSQSDMHSLLGKHGDVLWRYANGMDDEPVRLFGDEPEVKSVSRGRTLKWGLVTERDLNRHQRTCQ